MSNKLKAIRVVIQNMGNRRTNGLVLSLVLVASLLSSAGIDKTVDAEDLLFGNVINASGQRLGYIAASGDNVYVLWHKTQLLPSGNIVATDVFFRVLKADGSEFGPEINISNTEGRSESMAIATSGSNVYVLWWEVTSNSDDSVLGPRGDLFLRRSADNGKSFEQAINLSSTGGVSWMSEILVSGTNAYILWQDISEGNEEVFFRASNDDGATWGSTINLSKNSGKSYIQGHSIAASGNNVYVVWQDSSPNQSGILFRASKDVGSTFNSVINLGEKGLSYRPVVATSGNNVYVAGLNNPDPSKDHRELSFVASNNNGASFGEPVRLSDTGRSESPIMGASGNKVYISWVDIQGPSFIGWEVFFRVSIDAGSTFKAPVNLSGKIYNNPGHNLAIHGSTIYLSWSADNKALLRISNDGGFTFKDAIDVSNGTVQTSSVMVVSDSKLYLAWISKDGMSFRMARLPVTSAEITIDPIITSELRWGIDNVLISGTVTGALVTDSIEIDWGDGTSISGVSHRNGSWGPVSHTYDAEHVGKNNIVVELFEGRMLKASSDPYEVYVQKHATSITIDPISNMETGSSVTVTGSLFDKDAKIGITGRLVTFNATGIEGLSHTVTFEDGAFSSEGTIKNTAGLKVKAYFAEDKFYLPSFNSTGNYEDKRTTESMIELSGIALVDIDGKSISKLATRQKVMIESNIKNKHGEEQPLTYIAQIKDSDGSTVFLSWIKGSLKAAQSMDAAVSWTPDVSGKYTAEIFIWNSLTNPVPLSEVSKMEFYVN